MKLCHSDSMPRISILIPCYNEETTIQKVIEDFRQQLPSSNIIVFDNCSTDNTAVKAKAAGAYVHPVLKKGKGAVVAEMLSHVDSDYYIMVDGDDTYPADKAQHLLRPLIEGKADMMVGNRLFEFGNSSFRPFHLLGNKIITRVTNLVFSSQLQDVLSGYRAFTRAVADSLPAVSTGFEVESEVTLLTLRKGFVIREVTIPYRERPRNSISKLRTFKDGFRILIQIGAILITFKPLTLFGAIGIALMAISIIGGAQAVTEFIRENLLKSYAIMAASLFLGFVAFLSLFSGIILYIVNNLFINYGNLITRKQQHIYKIVRSLKRDKSEPQSENIAG